MLKEEIKHIMREFYRLSMSRDAAMMFITQNDVSLDDLMMYEYKNKKYHKAIWSFITEYTVDKIKNGKYESIINDIIPKLEINEYKARGKEYYDRDYLICSYLLIVFRNLIEEGMFDMYSFTLSLLQIQGIDNNIIANIIINDYRLLSPQLIMNYLDLGLLAPDIFCKILVDNKESYDTFWIDRLVEIYMSENSRILELFLYLNEIIEFKTVRKKTYYDFIKVTNCNNKDKKTMEYIFGIVCKRIVIDANIMHLTKINNGVESYREEKVRNVPVLNAYRDYLDWFISTMENINGEELLSNYINDKGEEGEVFPDEFYQIFRYEVIHMNDIGSIVELEDYEFFLRAFNMNRFKIYSFLNEELVEKTLAKLPADDERLLLAEIALQEETYITLNLTTYSYI